MASKIFGIGFFLVLSTLIQTNVGGGKLFAYTCWKTSSYLEQPSIRSLPNWAGVYKMRGECKKEECCCPAAFTLTNHSSNQLRIQVQFVSQCKEALDAVLPLPPGFQITLVVSHDKLNVTLNDDSTILYVANINRPPCSDVADRNTAILWIFSSVITLLPLSSLLSSNSNECDKVFFLALNINVAFKYK